MTINNCKEVKRGWKQKCPTSNFDKGRKISWR